MKSSGFDEKQAESVVETIDKAVNETVAAKADLEVMAANMVAKMATKEELKALATKDDIKDMATKTDLALLAANMATKDDIKDMVTKMGELETRMLRMMLFQTLVVVGMLIPLVAKLL